MGRNLSYLVVLMSVLFMVVHQQHVFVGAVLPPAFVDKWHVHVINGLSNGKLFVHCKSRDTDIGEQYINHGAEIQWSFKENVWGTTLFWCFVKNPNGSFASFEVFWHEAQHYWLHYRCTLQGTCFWTAKDDGIYLRNIPDGIEEKIHEWKRG
ncbi:S-protein homolog 1-like [Benincasa hispida]|uniref:S-protein homolog 1-like n=1 Tax=Benincasa hispida TaxID=102211 RepID=UPI0018FF1137|nr:S-protein homolog 1-like [Benincasa hispida]